jgi:hypothetical protein
MLATLILLRRVAISQKSYAFIYSVGIIALPFYEFLRIIRIDRKGSLMVNHRYQLGNKAKHSMSCMSLSPRRHSRMPSWSSQGKSRDSRKN